MRRSSGLPFRLGSSLRPCPSSLARDAAGNFTVVDSGNHLIRKVTPAGVVTTFAGSGSPGSNDGTGTAAQLYDPTGVGHDGAGDAYVAEYSTNRIRKVTPTGFVTALAGSQSPAFADGTGTAAQFNHPTGVAVGAESNIYVADTYNYRIRKVTTAGVVTTLAGSGEPAFADGAGAAASFQLPFGIAVGGTGNVYVGDSGSQRIRKVTIITGMVTTLAGSGTAGLPMARGKQQSSSSRAASPSTPRISSTWQTFSTTGFASSRPSALERSS